jgi:hypothetical protein
MAALHANLELRAIAVLAAESGIDTGGQSFIGECAEAAIAGYDNARAAWLAGDDVGAGRFVIWSAMLAGMASRDNVKFQRDLARRARSSERSDRIKRAKQLHGIGQSWPEIVKRLVATFDVSEPQARKDCIAAGRPERVKTKPSR